jgi:hypothetical protein
MVVVGDVLDDLGRQTVGVINAAGGQAEYVHLDVTKEADNGAPPSTSPPTNSANSISW